MTSLTDARTAVFEALRAGVTDVPVHEFPPATLTAPAVVVVPGNPWLDETGVCQLEVVCLAAKAGGPGNVLQRLEAILAGSRDALRAAAIAPGPIGTPTDITDAYTARYPVEQRAEC